MMPRLLVLKALRDLRKGWLSFGACALITALACAVFVAFTGSVLHLERASELTYERLRFLDFTLPVRDATEGSVERIRQLPGVKAAVGRIALGGEILMDPLPAPAARSRKISARILSLPAQGRPAVNDLVVDEGRELAMARGEVLLERRFAHEHHVGLGDLLRVHAYGRELRLRVVGLVSSPEFLWLAVDRYDPRPAAGRLAVVFVSLGDARYLAGSARLHEIHVTVTDPTTRDRLMEAAARTVAPELADPPIPREEQPSHALLLRDRRAFAGVAALFPALCLSLSGLILAVAMWQLVTQQRRQMGILMALGFSPRQLYAHYLLLSALVGGSGALVGCVAGHLLGVALTRGYAAALGLPFVEPELLVEPLATAAAVTLALSLLAGAWAAGRVLGLDPAQAVRADFSSAVRSPLGILRFLGGAPLWLRLALRNLLRQPARSAVAVIGIASAVAGILMTLGFVDGQRRTLDFSFEHAYAYDLRVFLHGPTGVADLPALESWPGVSRVERYRRVGAVLRHGDREVRTSLWGTPPESHLLRLYDRRERPVPPPEADELLLGPALLADLDARPGDTVQVELPHGSARHVPTWSYHLGPELSEPVTNPGRAALRQVQRQAAATYGHPPDAVNMLLIGVEPGAVESVTRRLQRERSVAEIVSMPQMRREIGDLLRMVQAFSSVMLLLASGMAFAILVGTTTMNLMDRTSELATMGVLGVPRALLLRMLVVETLLLWLLGLALGIPAGYGLAEWLVRSYQTDLLQITVSVRPVTLLGTAAVSLVLCLAAVANGLRTVQRIPLTEATQAAG